MTKPASRRLSGQRQGRQKRSSTRAEKPTRSADVPSAPMSGNSFLAKDVPMHSEVTEPSTASAGSTREGRGEVMQALYRLARMAPMGPGVNADTSNRHFVHYGHIVHSLPPSP